MHTPKVSLLYAYFSMGRSRPMPEKARSVTSVCLRIRYSGMLSFQKTDIVQICYKVTSLSSNTYFNPSLTKIVCQSSDEAKERKKDHQIIKFPNSLNVTTITQL